jgi:hypothetical protein
MYLASFTFIVLPEFCCMKREYFKMSNTPRVLTQLRYDEDKAAGIFFLHI